jgi:hypothetical protein
MKSGMPNKALQPIPKSGWLSLIVMLRWIEDETYSMRFKNDYCFRFLDLRNFTS